MKTRAIAAALLVSLAPTAFGVSAFAQADDPITKQARTRFQEGVDYFDKGNFESARASFLQAYALKKHPAVLLNLGLSCLKSNHPLEALTYLKQFLRESTTASAQQKSEAEAGIRDAKAKLGQIEVIAPSGTEITVDNDRIGTTPLSEPIDVEPGPKAVRARLPDGSTDTQRLTAAAGQKVQAKFGGGATPPVVAPVPVPAPATTTPATTPPTTGPTDTTPPTQPENNQNAAVSADTGPKKNLLSPPETMVPVWIGLGFAVVGTGVGIGFYFAKTSAQDNANQIANEIRTKGGTPGICSSTKPADVQKFGKACTALKDNNDKVDADATVANVAVVVAALGAATALGWYLFAPKKHEEKSSAFKPVVTPQVAPGYGGLGISGSF